MTTAGCRCCVLAALSVAVGVGIAFSGCGPSGPARLPVTGRISGNDAEKLDGAISFTPAQGNSGMGATCALKAGVYQFDRSNGPTAGAYDVSIRRTPPKPTGRPASGQRQEWNFKAEVQPGGPYTIDFTLD